MPVALDEVEPSGFERFVPRLTPVAIMIGIFDVACIAAAAAGVPAVTITSTQSVTRSCAAWVRRSLEPFAQHRRKA